MTHLSAPIVNAFLSVSSMPRCDLNLYNIRYAAVLAKQRGIKRVVETSDEDEQEESEVAFDAADVMLVA